MKLNSVKPLVFVSLLCASLWACDDSQSIDQDDDKVESQEVGVKINDVLKGKLDVANLDADLYETVKINETDTRVVSIATVIRKVLGLSDGSFEDELAKYTCDYESATDGFRPSSKGDKCAPVSCKMALYSYVDLNTGNLVYGAERGENLPGCYNVKNLGAVLMTPINDDAKTFSLYMDGTKMGSIDLQNMGDKIVEKDGKKVVLLSDVFERLQPQKTDQIDALVCDLADASGKKMSDDAGCPARACKDVLKGYIEVSTLNVTDAAGAAIAACYEMTNAAELHMNTPKTDDSYNVRIIIDDKDSEAITVDVKTIIDYAETETVTADKIIAAVNPNLDLSAHDCNFTSELGETTYNPITDKPSKCGELRSCTLATTAELNVTTGKLTMNDGGAACYNTGDLDTIRIYTKKDSGENTDAPAEA